MMDLLKLRYRVAIVEREKSRSLLQNTLSFIGLFCKRDL